MNMDKVNEALAHLKNAEITAAQSFQMARTKLKEAIGDQNADGAVDLKDVAIRAEKIETAVVAKIGGWTLRDTKVGGALFLAGYVFAKVFPIVKPLLASLF